MKTWLLVLFSIAFGIDSSAQSFDLLSATPPMGWNSWKYLKCGDLNEIAVKAQAQAMVSSGLRDAGYVYINIDDCWQGKRDASGALQADPAKFPGGMKALAEFIHARGLKLGLLTDRGLTTCQKRPGSYGHEEQDAKTFASWGVDFLKETSCHLPKPAPSAFASYQKMSNALKATKRPIILSLANEGEDNVWSWGAQVASLWRTHADLDNRFSNVLKIFDTNLDHASKQRAGAWNDPGSLGIGRTGLSDREDQTQMSLWAISGAPLVLSHDLTRMNAKTLQVLTNREVLAVDQDSAGRQGTLVYDNGSGLQIYSKVLSEPGSRAIVVLNRGEEPTRVIISMSTLGLEDHAYARDLWAQSSLGLIEELLVIDKIERNEAKMFRIDGQNIALFEGSNLMSQLNFEFQAVGKAQLLKRDTSLKGHAITLNAKKYTNGLAAPADSELTLALDRSSCTQFTSDIGVDDEVGKKGSVIFQVWGDDTKLFESPVMKGRDAHRSVSVSIEGYKKLRLVTLATDDGNHDDSADWANAQISCQW